jgi:D-alanine-D-alanine ligase
VARFDFFLTAAGPVLNEVNTAPGFTAQSQVPRMFSAAGVTYPALLDALVADALC